MTTTESTTTIEQTLPTVVLADMGATRGNWKTTTLEDVRDDLRKRTVETAPIDFDRSLGMYHVSFGSAGLGRTSIRLLGPQGFDGEPMHITRHAMRQLAGEVLPSHGLGFLDSLTYLGEQGRKLADVNMAMFMRQADTPRLARTAVYEGTRTVRAVLSQKYTTYDDMQMVEDLLSSVATRDLPVLSYKATDTGIRLRFALHGNTAPELRQPIPVIEAWNSEVGRRRVGLQAGMWKLVCTNGMGSWDKDASYSWIHQGAGDRIRRGIESAVADLQTRASGVVDAYNRALDTAVEDAIGWMNATLSEHLTEKQLGRAQVALFDETTTPDLRLASIIDAVTLAAQDEPDMYAQQEMERAAFSALRLGLSAASGGVIRAA